MKRCSFLVLGEDSAGDAHATLVALAKKLLRLIDPYHDSDEVRFEPPEGASVRAALRGNLWKSRAPADYAKRRELIGYIATKLLEGERSFVIFHVDGDRPWGERADGENARKFEEFIATDVKAFVEHRLRKAGRPVDGLALSQLLLLVPYYSIESWLFQNTRAGRKLCLENNRCGGEHVALFDDWEKDRARLDDEVRPKEMVCFRSDENHRLAEGLDIEAVYYAARSLHATVEDLMAREPLVRALGATRPA